MTIATQDDESVITDINRLIDFHKLTDKPLITITVTKKQYNRLMKMNEKAKNGVVLSRQGNVRITDKTYNGIPFEVKEPARRSRRKRDTPDLF